MNKKTNIIIGALLVSLGIVLGILGTTLSRDIIIGSEEDTATTTDDNEIDLEDYLIEVIKAKSYFFQNEEHLIEGALMGIVDSLEDPYSTYFSEEAYEEYVNSLREMMYGIGITVNLNGPYPIIIKVEDGSPAYEAGLRRGHTIKTVDGIDIQNKTIPEIAELIKGEENTVRVLGVYSNNPNVVDQISVTVGLIQTKSVFYDYLNINNHKIGYLKITSFSDPTYEEMLPAINHLENKNIEDLIIDVRDNPGGYLTSVQDILDYFINTDEPFMYSITKDNTEKKYYIKDYDHEINYNIVVLMNENSASASEIFSATMNEMENYQLIGKTTFGKGTMQNSFPLNSEHTSYVKLTTAKWLTPNKVWIHDVGVEPTIDVDQTNYQDISYIDTSQNISFDHVNEEIKDVQLFLNRKFDKQVRTDGYFDIDTENAVKDYQDLKEIEQTGIVDDLTAYYMNLDIMDYLNDKTYDNQYQKALDYILNDSNE